ncbi:hypothetical protein [Ovoidimarina sediminis]|uniref:hypothetical protein n=1 Tax=Ovoidimarina sediminis TaxID=3079856 RepID=UPI0029140180|nr:hypothetical protein [Rhodophyticola sp. MJ-SS7]MDU8944591.1 hypothetical protein [Rhodophyticola sp. MJ-SS7]
MRYLAGFACLAVLAACTDPEVGEQMVGDAMRPAIQEVVSKEYPLVPAPPVVQCVIDNANEEESTRILQAAIEGVTGRDNIMIVRIVNRPGTQACISDAGVPLGMM